MSNTNERKTQKPWKVQELEQNWKGKREELKSFFFLLKACMRKNYTVNLFLSSWQDIEDSFYGETEPGRLLTGKYNTQRKAP